MRYIEYYDGERKRRIEVQGLFEARQLTNPPKARTSTRTPMSAAMRPQASGGVIATSIHAQESRFTDLFRAVSETNAFVMPADKGGATVIPTETVAIDGARVRELQWARRTHGLEVVKEASHGKVLMRVPGDAQDGIGLAATAALQLHERGTVDAAHPNFLRAIQHPATSAAGVAGQWALDNPGDLGLIGADANALAAWTITKGSSDVRVAILDEGVDTLHPYLKAAVVAEKDFVDENDHAKPDGNDAHGTACAGIVASRNSRVSGLAPGVSLVAARIAKSNEDEFWIMDDFQTADAIDWCWDTARADVLSNSWGGGPPVPIITQAFERARTQGRDRLGAIVVAAAGNEQGPVSYPGTMLEVMTVGASNQWDERKTRTSNDGENWWGSNHGKALDLVAPGVMILTCDIRGQRGYGNSTVTEQFNGTSAATPFVAATAALMLSVRPDLTEVQVRELIGLTADPLNQTGWTSTLGSGRLNAYEALRAARRA